MKINIVIPNYNGEELLKKNLPSVFASVTYFKKATGNISEIIIVDDASTDNSVRFIKDLDSNIRLIKNQKNLGFSSAVNQGVKEADGECIVLLNSDVCPKEDFLIPLIKHFDNERIFAVGCMDESIENGKTVLRGRGIGRWEKGFLVHRRGEIDKNNTLWVSGGSAAFRKSIWEKLGGFNTLYNPFYWEDIDLSYRALKSGYLILFEKESVVTHRHEEGIIKKKYSPLFVKTIAYRNQFIFVWLNATDFSLVIDHVLWLPYHFFAARLRGDAAFFMGFLRAFIHIPKILQSIFTTRHSFVKSDNEVVREFIQ